MHPYLETIERLTHDAATYLSQQSYWFFYYVILMAWATIIIGALVIATRQLWKHLFHRVLSPFLHILFRAIAPYQNMICMILFTVLLFGILWKLQEHICDKHNYIREIINHCAMVIILISFVCSLAYFCMFARSKNVDGSNENTCCRKCGMCLVLIIIFSIIVGTNIAMIQYSKTLQIYFCGWEYTLPTFVISFLGLILLGLRTLCCRPPKRSE